ncbi:MAG: DUF3105 domain-containing protein [Caldilineaceae bacterium]
MRREKAAQQRRNQNLIIGAAAAVFVLVIGFVIFLQVRNAQPVAGEEALATQGNIHIDFGSISPIAYNSTPPTSGPHYDNLVAWGIYNEPQRYEHLVHNLEDGGVIVYYQCADGCPETVANLEELVRPYVDRGAHVVMVPNDPTWSINGSQPLHQDMGATIALTAWQHILKLDEVDGDKIRAFIERYEGIDHHVAGIG